MRKWRVINSYFFSRIEFLLGGFSIGSSIDAPELQGPSERPNEIENKENKSGATFDQKSTLSESISANRIVHARRTERNTTTIGLPAISNDVCRSIATYCVHGLSPENDPRPTNFSFRRLSVCDVQRQIISSDFHEYLFIIPLVDTG